LFEKITWVIGRYKAEDRYIQGFGGEMWEKRHLGRLRHRWKDNIKMDIQQIE